MSTSRHFHFTAKRSLAEGEVGPHFNKMKKTPPPPPWQISPQWSLPLRRQASRPRRTLCLTHPVPAAYVFISVAPRRGSNKAVWLRAFVNPRLTCAAMPSNSRWGELRWRGRSQVQKATQTTTWAPLQCKLGIQLYILLNEEMSSVHWKTIDSFWHPGSQDQTIEFKGIILGIEYMERDTSNIWQMRSCSQERLALA